MSTPRKVKIAAISVCSNTLLIVLKVIAGILSGSVSIISEAIHSGMDLIASCIAFFSVKMSSKPADKEHPYGHGKIENVSGVIEGILIFIAAFLIIKEAIAKILHPSKIEETLIGVGVMTVSAIVNYLVSRKLYKVAKEEDSIALEADALHLKTDVYTSLGVAGGLLLLKLTGFTILDPIIAILVALLILKESWYLVSHAFKPLLDEKLSDEEEEKIDIIMKKYIGTEVINYHGLRTRKSGHVRYVDFHLNMKEDLSVKQSHDLSEIIEKDIEKEFKDVEITIHVEPGNLDLKNDECAVNS
jgi:cation diffusion facilitator family transporter